MADAARQASKHGSLISEIKTLFSLFKTKKPIQFVYGCMLALLLFTVFLAFSPSSNSPVSPINTSSILSEQSYRSHFSSIFVYFFPNSSQISPNIAPSLSSITTSTKNETQKSVFNNQTGENWQNQSTIEVPKTIINRNQTTIEVPKSTINRNNNTNEIPKSRISKNQSTIDVPKFPILSNSTSNIAPKSSLTVENSTENRTEKTITQHSVGVEPNSTSSPLKKQSNEGNLGVSAEQRSENLVKGLLDCDLYNGEWVVDDSYPLYEPGSCSLIDEQFNCFLNGRPDHGYYKLKWKPKGCSIPRLNGTHMLEMLRGKRLVFVGDSLNRNMWESLVCILRNSVKNQSKVYEASGRHNFRSEPSYSFVFEDYGFTVEFFVSPFLVQEWEIPEKNGLKKETLRLDLVGRSADQYKTADIIVFNTGHWWTHDKTAKGKDYYQEGSHVYHDLNVLEAFRKALTTWARWIDTNVNPKISLVFFRGYSASHFSGGQWNSGGQCDHETEPIKNTTYLSPYPPKMTVLEKVLKNMKTSVSYLNITRLTDFRKDAHPSIYRKQSYTIEELKSPLSFQDCSHWCLPGVPDAWNELLYAELLRKDNLNKQQ